MKRAIFVLCALVLAVIAAACMGMKGDECGGVQVLGGVFGLGPQPMVDETKAGTKLWYWIDAPYQLAPAHVGKVLYEDAPTGFSMAGVSSADHVTNQSFTTGIGANVSVDPARAAENYDVWHCHFWMPHGMFPIACPALRVLGENGAKESCRKVLYYGTTARFRATFSDKVACVNGGPWLEGNGAGWPKGLDRPPYIRSVDDARDTFNALALRAGYAVKPSAIVARSIVDVVADQRNSPGCANGKGDPGKAPPQGTAPPGAESPDAGGINVSPGTTPGNGSSSGDYP